MPKTNSGRTVSTCWLQKVYQRNSGSGYYLAGYYVSCCTELQALLEPMSSFSHRRKWRVSAAQRAPGASLHQVDLASSYCQSGRLSSHQQSSSAWPLKISIPSLTSDSPNFASLIKYSQECIRSNDLSLPDFVNKCHVKSLIFTLIRYCFSEKCRVYCWFLFLNYYFLHWTTI